MSTQLVPIALIVFAPALAAQSNLYTLAAGAAPGDESGFAVAGGRDLDGDGHDDVLVGAPGDQGGVGSVRVYSGRTGGVFLTVLGSQPGERFGHALDWLDDIDGDGKIDFVVGAPRFDTGPALNAGRVTIRSGADGSELKSFASASAGAQAGSAVCSVPDFTGDGLRDVAFGAPGFASQGANAGRVEACNGATLSSLYSVTGSGGEQLGYSLAALDGGGSAVKLLIGAPANSSISPAGGRVLLLGLAPYVPASTLVLGDTIAGLFGAAVGNAGDVNLDGVDDVLLGEPGWSGNGVGSGLVYVHSGAPPYPLLRSHPGSAGIQLGSAVAGVGDVDGDGRSDYLIGAPRADFLGSTDVGLVRLHSGATGAVLSVALGQAPGEMLGTSLAAAGHVNADGAPDLLLGAHDASATSGHARVVLTNAPLPTTYCAAKANSDGCTPKISWSGVPSLSVGNAFHVRATLVKPQMVGLMIWSYASGNTPFFGGTLCLGGAVQRTPAQSSGGDSPCEGSYDFHATHAWMSAQGMHPGRTVHAQFWSRDTGFAPPAAVGLTNAIAFPVLP